jgi:hypothetical protein
MIPLYGISTAVKITKQKVEWYFPGGEGKEKWGVQ